MRIVKAGYSAYELSQPDAHSAGAIPDSRVQIRGIVGRRFWVASVIRYQSEEQLKGGTSYLREQLSSSPRGVTDSALLRRSVTRAGKHDARNRATCSGSVNGLVTL